MKRIIFSIALLTLLVVISFASFAETTIGFGKYKDQRGFSSNVSHKNSSGSLPVIQAKNNLSIN